MKAELFGIGGAMVLLAVGLTIIGVLVYLQRPLYLSTPGLIWGGMVLTWMVLWAIIG